LGEYLKTPQSRAGDGFAGVLGQPTAVSRLMLVGTQHLGLQSHMVGQQGIGDNSTVLAKILA
jgi:hypothetical protein